MTKAEENVVQWACQLAEAIVAGTYGLSRPMNIAVNSLQDAILDLVKESGSSRQKLVASRKAKKEYETYLKLKRKYESKQPELHITSVWMDEESRKKIPPPKVYDENGKRIV